ncbi:2-hydroxyacid dehydrogenase [Thalassotalea marina]|uniref:Glyoxylate/hydroxypyruvate reductase A n=1 Tax=Thalassotalea marina TaxID=1673741 RepID=A0A919EM62_9GAMM|nr:glyoxylate/hydroxypyruvate reductase A [Thalassotalea marina]GHF97967.1 glyoxylate/hydroxypyruvate reductase A [Thalassotalea marina]
MILIPFINQLPKVEQQQWLVVLNDKFAQRQINAKVVLVEEISEAQRELVNVAIVANPKPEHVRLFANLQWLQSVWAGVEKLVQTFAGSELKISRLVDPTLAQTMSEAVVAWSFYAMRDMPLYRQQQRAQHWQQHPVKLACDTKVAILGLGELGQQAAQQLLANNFQVIGWSNSAKDIAGIECFNGDEQLPQVLSQADIVVCLLPLTEKTHGLFNQHTLALMPSQATLINFGRGAIIDEYHLLEALDDGVIKHAILDVFAVEPLDEEHAFWSHDHITVLPHISAPTNVNSASDIVVNNVDQFINGGQLPATVNLNRGY